MLGTPDIKTHRLRVGRFLQWVHMVKLNGLFTIGDKAKEKPGIREQLKAAKTAVSSSNVERKSKKQNKGQHEL